jgi:tetratricopeptide (TPR) repeat protein
LTLSHPCHALIFLFVIAGVRSSHSPVRGVSLQTAAEPLLEAIRLQQAGCYAEAESQYRAVLAKSPNHPQATYLYGLLLLGAGDPATAVPMLRAAVTLQPKHTGARVNLTRALLAVSQPDAALAEADAVLALAPEMAEAAFLRGTALNALGQPTEAVAAFSTCLAGSPDHAAAQLNLGNAYADLDQLTDAERCCRRAIVLNPELAEAHASLGFVLTSLGSLDEAISACQAAIRLRPDFAQAHWNLAVAALLAGDFALGFREYEWRKRHDRFRRDFINLPGPVWDGAALEGRTLLVHAEQGFGDTIQFARYLPLLATPGAKVVLACDRPLLALLSSLPGVAAVAKDAPLPPYDCWLDQMSLPLQCATEADSIPLSDGYLSADPTRQAAWSAALPPGLKVGIAWAGNPLHSNDRRRSLPYAALQRLLAAPGIQFVNLQLGPRADETGLPVLPLPLTDYGETAALIANLDLVVTVDTSVAHVAGALGARCWVMLPFAPDWRWRLNRWDTPWYRSLRLFRQPSSGDWDAVVDAILTSLREFAA